jgi:uncharacterized glyoxalase superfamily protein PhnB
MSDTTTDATAAAAPAPAPDAVPAATVWPCLNYADAPAAIEFLVAAFGFRVHTRYDTDDGAVAHAELTWPPGGGIMLGSSSATSEALSAVPTGAAVTYVPCDDPDGLAARAEAAGAEITVPLRDTDYGSRDFAARDPEGNVWSFGTYRGAAHPSS